MLKNQAGKALSTVGVWGFVVLFVAFGWGFAEEAADRDAMAAAATPGEHHEHLAHLAGEWAAEGTFWIPGAEEPVRSTGTMVNRMMMGGRFLRTEYSGDFLGSSFEGFGLEGFDNVTGKHTSFWVDNMGTTMLTASGTCSADHKSTTLISEFVNPMGQKEVMRSVTTLDAPDRHTMVAYTVGDDGQETKTMEIVYTRK